MLKITTEDGPFMGKETTSGPTAVVEFNPENRLTPIDEDEDCVD